MLSLVSNFERVQLDLEPEHWKSVIVNGHFPDSFEHCGLEFVAVIENVGARFLEWDKCRVEPER